MPPPISAADEAQAAIAVFSDNLPAIVERHREKNQV